MKIYLIRHGKTAGNEEQRYVGTTDEAILKSEHERLSRQILPSVDGVYASPRMRCLETAALLYPGQKPVIVEGLAECDFGEFEYKNYKELSGNADYQAWIDSGGTIGFPGGENREEFQNRCQRAYWRVLLDAERKGYSSIAMVVHGGTIMALMERLARPHADYYSWHPENGGGYIFDSEEEKYWKLEIKT